MDEVAAVTRITARGTSGSIHVFLTDTLTIQSISVIPDDLYMAPAPFPPTRDIRKVLRNFPGTWREDGSGFVVDLEDQEFMHALAEQYLTVNPEEREGFDVLTWFSDQNDYFVFACLGVCPVKSWPE
jgi:hypothetical protein